MTAVDEQIDQAMSLVHLDERTVYQRMLAIIDELPAIGKTQRNEQQKFMFRGHDDVMNALNPLLAKHGVFIVPDVLERVTAERQTGQGKTMYEVNLHVRFTFYGAQGDSFVATGWGEGTDMGDKATNKAMTMAFKYVVAQSFALATAETSDADVAFPEETTRGSAQKASPRRSDAPSRTPEFDPGRDLMEGAIRVMGEKDANTVWAALRALDDTQDWEAVQDFAAQHVFGVDRERLTAPQWGEFWKRLANTVVKAGELVGTGDFPPADPEKLSEAFAWGFEGVQISFGGTTVEKKE